MGISEQNVMDYIAAAGQSAGDHTSVWAVRMPSIINMALFGPAANLFDMRYNILNISDKGIMLIGVDGAGNLRPEHIWLAKENIQGLKIKKGMVAYDIQLETAMGPLKYRVNKVMIGSGFHKANFDNTIKTLESFA